MNNKFSNNIPQSEKELYFNQNKEVLGLSEFINNYVNQVLEEENKQEFEKQDFELMKGYVENLVKYQNIVEKVIGEKVSIKIVEKFILGQSLEEFEKFLKENKEVVYLRICQNIVEEIIGEKVNIRIVEKLVLGQSLVEFEKFLKENKEVVNLIKYGRKENLNKVWKLFEIKTKEDLLKIVENKKYIHFFKAIINNDIKTIEELFNTKANIQDAYSINIGYGDINDLGACGSNEYYSYNILKNNEYKDVKILMIGNEIIGYIKLVGEETFLSFKDIFDSGGNLIFKKGWIYTISIEDENNEEEYIHSNNIFENDYLDISKIEGLKRKPIRKIKAYHNKELYDNFDKLVKNFIKGYKDYKN